MTKILFLDIDGPLIPMRAYFLPGQTKIVSLFDPCATSLVLKLIEQSGAKLVVSSSWGSQGYDKCMAVFEKNGIARSHFHTDWVTPRKMSSERIHEIKWWLDDHPEVTHYVAIDDEGLDVNWVPNSVLCDAYEGFSWRNYLECKVYLDIHREGESVADKTVPMIQYLKKREIWRTKRRGEEGSFLTQQAADLVFPQIPPNKDE